MLHGRSRDARRTPEQLRMKRVAQAAKKHAMNGPIGKGETPHKALADLKKVLRRMKLDAPVAGHLIKGRK